MFYPSEGLARDVLDFPNGDLVNKVRLRRSLSCQSEMKYDICFDLPFILF